jgi:hypothetical protein
MTRSLKFLTQAALLAGAAALALIATLLPASALIACNKFGECWHVRANYVYRPEFGVVVHPDNWHWGRHEHFRWHEHAGRGYWRKGIWITF